MIRILKIFFSVLALCPPSFAQQNSGISPCTTDPPASLSVTTSSANVQLGTCGPTVVVLNITSQEVFFKLGATSAIIAATTSNSLPGNTFIVLSVPTSGQWFAAITASGTSTIRFIQGRGY